MANDVLFFKELCHGCGGCKLVCPKDAITEEKRNIGIIEKGLHENIEFYHGLLNIGELMVSSIISKLKEKIDKNKITIIDSPPGTACPVIESIIGSDFCILVTEPTPFGLHDLKITVQVLKNLGIPMGVIINRAGIGDRKIYEFCEIENIPLLLEIPFDKKIAELYSCGIPFVVTMPEWKEKFREILNTING